MASSSSYSIPPANAAASTFCLAAAFPLTENYSEGIVHKLNHGKTYHKLSVFENTTGSRKIAALETEKMEYVGDSAATPSYAKYMVAFIEEEEDSNDAQDGNESITVVEAIPVTMAPIIKAHKRPADAERQIIGPKDAASRNSLGDTFGTKKRRMAIKAIEKNKVDMRSLEEMRDTIGETMVAGDLPTRDEVRRTAALDKPIPPCNVDAPSPDKVYDQADIIPTQDWDAIPVQRIIKARVMTQVTEDLSSLSPPAWILEKIAILLQTKNTDQIKRLLYLIYMIRFFKLRDRDMGRANKVMPIVPESILLSLRSRFAEYHEDVETGNIEYRVPRKEKDRLLAYILVLCLMTHNYSFDPMLLAMDVSLPQTRVIAVAKELGCRVDATRKSDDAAGQKVIKLLVPLVFPTRTR